MVHSFEETVERLIRISKEKPLLPETFVPWERPFGEEELFMPERLVSLEGHPLWNGLSDRQKLDLGRHEIVQVLYSYAWSEGLACLFFNRRLLTLKPDSQEYRFLIRELIEEYRHQDMFSTAVVKLNGQPVLPGWRHRLFGYLTVRFFPADFVFISVLSVELMTDIYGKHIRRDASVILMLRKIAELHHIEEGRHIYYTKIWLERFTSKAGFVRRSFYSILVLLNVYFMRTLYVKSEIFKRISVPDPDMYARAAAANLKAKLGAECLGEAVEFVREINGFNWLTRPLWRWVAKVKVHG